MITETRHQPQPYSAENPYQPLGGDLQNLPHEQRVQVLNNTALRLQEALLATDPATIDMRANTLLDGVDLYRAHVDERYTAEQRQELITRYKNADHFHDASLSERITARFGAFPDYQVVTDVDGTLTKNPSDYLIRLTPGSALGEELLEKNGRSYFAQAFAQSWQPLLEQAPGEFQNGGRRVPLREGVADFFAWQKKQGKTVEIISANFRPFVYGVLDQIPYADGTRVHAVDADSIVATDKGTILTEIALKNPNQAVVYVGDGSSDEAALAAKDMVACYFALAGESFERRLQEEGLPYLAYESYNDIALHLTRLALQSTKPIQ